MQKTLLEARLQAAGTHAAFDGETATPHVSVNDGMATIGVYFKRRGRTTERMTIHGSVYTEFEERKLIDDVMSMLEQRARRPEPRKETLKYP
ncbi:MAG: hypothetical protein GIX03_16535 [Candidatus Eremiobacteraeota bacterium]|nr:hypothetical protein [Candidatus Eremiobacteraeota bacterium]MBC5804567.1 hypothetical protein [Candidatus Eremiobacteraeota bacterium]MBC5821956.1 hypothetical protein [Candidatus Eremiobacteraeota bacterium]